jgi:PadR family transcriptional regulator PadR
MLLSMTEESHLKIEKELLKGNTPLLVLAILRDGPLHGYAIAREIERRSSHLLKFKEGTLYPVLHSLEHNKWLESSWDTTSSGPARKVYALTAMGQAELAKRTSIWQEFSTAVGNIIKGGTSATSS